MSLFYDLFSFLYIIRLKSKRKRSKVLLDLLVEWMNNKLDYLHDHDQYKSDSITSENIMNFNFFFNGKLMVLLFLYEKTKQQYCEITAEKIGLRKIF